MSRAKYDRDPESRATDRTPSGRNPLPEMSLIVYRTASDAVGVFVRTVAVLDMFQLRLGLPKLTALKIDPSSRLV